MPRLYHRVGMDWWNRLNSHGRVAALAVLVWIGPTLRLVISSGWSDFGTDWNAASTLAQLHLAGFVLFGALALWLDTRWPRETFGRALIRMAVPFALIATAIGIIAEIGLNAGGRFHLKLAAVLVTAAAIFGAAIRRRAAVELEARSYPALGRPRETVGASDPQLLWTLESLPASPPTEPSVGKPMWGWQPPSVSGPASPATSVSPASPQPRRSWSDTHLFWSIVVSAGLALIAPIVWILANWCTTDLGRGTVVVAIWLTVNAAGGIGLAYVLDQRVADRGGAMLILGRCVAVACGLLILSWPIFLFLPSSTSCG